MSYLKSLDKPILPFYRIVLTVVFEVKHESLIFTKKSPAMWRQYSLSLFLLGVLAQDFEWTALGDSYASGVGSGEYVDGRRCLRYDQAYPSLLNEDPNLSPLNHIYNNVACSGSTTEEVELYQFYDEDTSNQPNWQFCRFSTTSTRIDSLN
jgi:hypothetical protein